jgi:hypothetical protein
MQWLGKHASTIEVVFPCKGVILKQTAYSDSDSKSEVIVSVLISVAGTRLVETENPSACATVNWKVSKSTIALNLNVIKKDCKQITNKDNHPNYTSSFS